MKKLFAFISVFLMLSVSIFADVSVKKLDNGKYEVTFFYGNPRAAEVVVAGDFTNWQNDAVPMTKTDKGWTYTTEVSAGTTMKYKFISDGNWTADIKAPDTVDDGFGGLNGLVDVDALAGGNGDGGKKASIKFITWTMLGAQGKFNTQGVQNKAKKGYDFDSASLGFKSYNKLTGQFLPNMPFYVEIALAETELDDAYSSNSPIYLAKKNADGTWATTAQDGLLNAVNGLFTSPFAYLGQATSNPSASNGPGSNPYLGHLKAGFDTPYVKFMTGFNYAKPDSRKKVLWTTVDKNWDAGYQHIGGFAQFSLGDKLAYAFQDSGITLDAGFAPNQSADRKGSKKGYWGWLGMSMDNLVVDFQSNGMYDGNLFCDAVEHDFILGAKDKFEIYMTGNISVAAQVLASTHQKASADLGDTKDYFGYSTDVFYRDTNFGVQNLAAELNVGFEEMDKKWGVTLDYRMRGAQASMLFLRENHDDGTFDLSNELGVLNSQNIALDAFISPMKKDALNIGLKATAKLPLENLKASDTLVDDYINKFYKGWYQTRNSSEMDPMFDKEGVELKFVPSATYRINDDMTVGAYATMKVNMLKKAGVDQIYGASDSAFLFQNAGVTFSASKILKGLDVYYGLDNSNDVRMFNTLVANLKLPGDLTVNAGLGLKTVKTTAAAKAYNAAENNPFAFSVGASKKLKVLAKPIVYAQFEYNTNMYKNFGDGQDALALDGANLSSRWDKGAEVGSIDAVDWYDGKSAVRCGIRWDL